MTILETEVSVSGFIKYVPVSPLTFVTVVLEVSLPTQLASWKTMESHYPEVSG